MKHPRRGRAAKFREGQVVYFPPLKHIRLELYVKLEKREAYLDWWMCSDGYARDLRRARPLTAREKGSPMTNAKRRAKRESHGERPNGDTEGRL